MTLRCGAGDAGASSSRSSDGVSSRGTRRPFGPYGLRAYAGSVVNFLSWRSDAFLISLLLGDDRPGRPLRDRVPMGRATLVSLSNADQRRDAAAHREARRRGGGDAQAADATRGAARPVAGRCPPAVAWAVLAPWFVPAFYGRSSPPRCFRSSVLLPGVVVWNVSRILTSDLARPRPPRAELDGRRGRPAR